MHDERMSVPLTHAWMSSVEVSVDCLTDGTDLPQLVKPAPNYAAVGVSWFESSLSGVALNLTTLDWVHLQFEC